MTTPEIYNSFLNKLLDEIEKEKTLLKTEKIACCTNGHSNIAEELRNRGYDAQEISFQKYKDSDFDCVITLLGYRDAVKLLSKVSETTKVYSMYRPILASNAPETKKLLESLLKGSVGTTENVLLYKLDNGKSVTKPFDNRLFIYDFSG